MFTYISVTLLTLYCFTKGIFITKADLLFFLEDFPKNLFDSSFKASGTDTYIVPGRIMGSDESDTLQDDFCVIQRELFSQVPVALHKGLEDLMCH